MKYAGIGSRKTPDEVLQYMYALAAWLAGKGVALSSGGAYGADTAFERGCKTVYGYKAIYGAEHVNQASIELAAKYHPAWDKCSDYAKKLHARNGFIILGADLNTPVDFIICWTPDGKIVGGTGQALRIAGDPQYNIPIFNLAVGGADDRLREWLAARGVS